MNKTELKQVIVELNNGEKIRGNLIEVDKINLKMILENVIKDLNGNEEIIDRLEINKSDIKELKLVHFENKKEENKNNINAIPENKIPQNKESGEKAYDKNESFFDKLTPITQFESRQESKNYNQRNKDTFNLSEQDQNNNNKKYYHNNYRGRGGYNKYYNNRGGYNNYKNNRGRYNNNNYNYGNNRGKYNKNFRGRGQRGRGGINNNNNFNNNNKNDNKNNKVNNQNLKPYEPEGGIKPEMEKSIYDN